MNFDSARLLDALVYDLVLSDYPRGQNRARIQNLANGAPPYTSEEVETNGVNVNVSDLTHTRLCHDARQQYANAFLKGGFFARAKTDAGTVHKRDQRATIVTREWNNRMKGSIQYFEALRAKFGLLTLHGIAPAVWENESKWCVKPLGVEDVLVPGETLLGFDNLPFFVVRRSFTGIELMKITAATKRDPGWNMDFVERILAWMEDQATMLRSLNWPDVWAPEKIAERTKEEAGGTLAGDRAPRIDVFDIYAYDDSGEEEGWVRRMILDAWSEPSIPNPSTKDFSRKTGVSGETNDFLYTSGTRKVARTWQNVISFQFADLSATFPARYHAVRSLGWMLYASCHLGNRLRCKFYESVLEALMMLYEVDNQTDAQNALKLNLINKGFIDKTIKPVKAGDRWQVNANLVELGLQDNASVISNQSRAFMQSSDQSRDKQEKTRFQVMAEMQAVTALVSAALNQAYMYQAFEFREIFRRFCLPNSSDPDVRSYRAACLKQGVPEKYLNDPDAWQIESERTMGAGNKTIEMTIADWLMQNRPAYDPEPQREILRRATLAYTDDAAMSLSLVPEQPNPITSAVREAEHICSTLMQGIPVEPLTGENHIEVIQTMLKVLTQKVQQGLQSGGMVPPEKLQGLQAIGQHIGQRIGMIAQDPAEKQRVKQFGDVLGKLMNELKGFAQRIEAQMKKQQEAQAGNGQMEPKDMAKIEAIKATAQAKIDFLKESHATRTAQKKIQFEQKLQMDQQKHQVGLGQEHQKHVADLGAKDLEAASNIRRTRLSTPME